jgi:hypothetical protein
MKGNFLDERCASASKPLLAIGDAEITAVAAAP